MNYLGAGEAIAEIEGYVEEHRNLCKDAWAPFNSRKVFNLLPGSLRVKSRSPRSTITFQVVSVTQRQLAIAPCIRMRSGFDHWIRMAPN